MPTNYSKSPNETIDQYNARIGMSKTTSAARDAYFQSLANVNPEAANNAMDIAGYGYAPAGSITSSTFAPVPGVQYQNPAPISSYPVGTLISQPLSAPEQNASDLTKQIQDLNNSLAGKDAYAIQAQQDNQVPQLYKQLDEYNSKITGLANQASSLDIASNYTIPNQMQLNAAGRGITTGGLAPIQASELRKIQIQKGAIASDALSTKAAADAVQGKLTSALYYADLAVKQKYAGMEGELKAKIANLDLIMKSPEYTKAQKDRAQQQQIALEQQQNMLDTQKENQKTIQGLALQALQNGAPPVVVDQIMKANDLPSAFNAASGYAAKETAASIQEYQFAVKNGYKGSFTQYQNEDANRKISIAAAGSGNGLTNYQTTQTFNHIVDKYNSSPLIQAADRTPVLQDAIRNIQSDPSNAAYQLNLSYSYIQALDTYQSAVREGELSLVNSIDSKAGQLQNYLTQIKNGQIVRPEVARQIADAAQQLVNTISSAAKKKASSFEAQARVAGVGPQFSQYASSFTPSYQTTQSTVQPKFNAGDIIAPQGPMGPQFRVNADGTATRIR